MLKPANSVIVLTSPHVHTYVRTYVVVYVIMTILVEFLGFLSAWRERRGLPALGKTMPYCV